MAKQVVTRRELLDRWRGIEEEDDDDTSFSDPSNRRRLRQLKEEWFSDAFNFLIYLPKGNHIWCGSWDLMGPLLETFYNYFKDDRHDSPLRLLWKRISRETRHCTQCICQHHQAEETYDVEYESSTIGPLLDVLRSLDEERVTQHLNEINGRIARGEYDPVHDNGEVVSVMFEVLMFPILLDDQSLATEFQIFIEAIDNAHELTLAGHQRYPGIYALLFLQSRRARSIGFRLAGYVGKLRTASDLEPLQPLLKKCISFLETEVLPSTTETSRPRVQLERITVWLGIKALLGFLEPPAFEEGILERYPIFLSIVLNHVSDDSLEFSYAVNCLRLLFEMLGCKLWLRATLSPSVMRNTLLGQCFHTRNEKSHKEIFDLFQPFLRSLEALQDGEHEKQRRHFLFFLLHQVTVSSNFSILMRKKACQIALQIIHRGYKMDPPCPPYECAHMWGPSLVSSLKDTSLHSSLRQPAFDLIQTVIVSDAAALVTSILNFSTPPGRDRSILALFNDVDDEGLLFPCDVEEDTSCWNEFSVQSKITSKEYDCWMCIPMLWSDILVEIDPAVLPVSFSKAVFWALSRLSMVDPENSTEIALPVRDWLKNCTAEISHLFGWKVPSGSEDGADGKESKNSIKVSTMCIPLVRTFKRLNVHFVVRMEQSELWRQWTWEPRMGESLILLIVDHNDDARQAGRRVLEQVSNMRGLSCGLQFLCCCSSALAAIFLGLRHALTLVRLDSVLSKFQNLHHFFFVLCKLLKEGITPTQPLGKSADDLAISKFSSQGGFLGPVCDSLPTNIDGHLSTVDSKSWEMFSCLLSEVAWPSIRKCFVEGKAFVDCKISQMTCIRLLEILPVVFERLRPDFHKRSWNLSMKGENGIDFMWLTDLMDWGKSSIAVVVRYWKQTVVSLLGSLKEAGSCNSASMIMGIEKIISRNTVAMDELAEQVSRLSVSLTSDCAYTFEKTNLNAKPFLSEGMSVKGKCSAQEGGPSCLEDGDVEILDSAFIVNKKESENVVIILDEIDEEISASNVTGSHPGSNQHMLDGKTIAPGADQLVLHGDLPKDASSILTQSNMLDVFQQTGPGSASSVSQKQDSDPLEGGLRSVSFFKSKTVDRSRKEMNSRCNVNDSFPSGHKSVLKNLSDETITSLPCQRVSNLKNSSEVITTSKSMDQQNSNKVSERSEIDIKELARDANDNPCVSALKSLNRQPSYVTKLSTFGPKRQAILLNFPGDNRTGRLQRLDGVVNRFKPPRLDDWYRPILQIDYFATVGLASASEEDNQNIRILKEVPVCFQSPDEYMDIFRPLVLEEFKAQLQSSFLEITASEMCCGIVSVLSVERIDDFHIVRCVHDDTDSTGFRSCLENDLILLTRQLLKNSSHDVHMVGKVERREKDNKRRSSILVIRFCLQTGCSRLNRGRKLLLERSKWYISRLMSITPQLREFQALTAIKDIPLFPIILNPFKCSLGHHKSGKEDLSMLSQPLQQILKSAYNDSQLQAISDAIRLLDSRKDFELSLIQGPPGTGKTRTIVAIISGLLALSHMNDKKGPLNGGLRRNTISCNNPKMNISQSAAIARAWQDAALARQLNEDAEKNCKATVSRTRGRVLICAQSNAAVDELVSRISSEGLYGSDGVMYKPYLVRVGNAKTVHPNSLPFFIDTLVDHRLAEERMNSSDPKRNMGVDSSAVLRSNLEKLVDHIRFYEAMRANSRDGKSDSKSFLQGGASKEDDEREMSDAEIATKLRKLYEEKKAIYVDLATAQAREKKVNEESKSLKHKLRMSILKEAEIVVATLSGCGGDLYGVCSHSISNYKFGNLSENTLFDAVVIDEAAQALEPATLIPLQLLKSRGTKCIMVGDPKQLPATVLSNVASKYHYQCSMFERLQRAGHPVIMLTKQYRMHPEICRFPSLHFYDSKLLNGDLMCSKAAPFHETEGLGPYVFFDVIDGQEFRGKNSGALSLYNECEADAAVEVLRFFKKSYPSEFVGGRFGIITPYKSQLSLLRSRFSGAFGSSVAAEMEFNTVDGFQGREVDILVLSTVRAAEPCYSGPMINNSNIGFVADARRMNVALTRAKVSLWILGNAITLQTNQNWAALVRDAKERNLVISVTKPYDSISKSTLKTKPASENSDDCSRQPKHDENTKKSRWHAKLLEKNAKHSNKKKRKLFSNGAQSDYSAGGEEHDCLTTGDAFKGNKNRVREEHDFAANTNVASVVGNSVNGTTKDVKSASTGARVTDKEYRAKKSNEKLLNMGNDVIGKRKGPDNQRSTLDLSKPVTGDGQKVLRSVDSKGLAESLEHNRKQASLDIKLPSPEGRFQETDGNGRTRASNQIDTTKQAITKRKQQRDAVDALLSSALISSKKPEISSKRGPVKRPLSPSYTAGHAIKPPKPIKVQQAPSSSSLHSQTPQYHRKRDKSLNSQGFG